MISEPFVHCQLKQALAWIACMYFIFSKTDIAEYYVLQQEPLFVSVSSGFAQDQNPLCMSNIKQTAVGNLLFFLTFTALVLLPH